MPLSIFRQSLNLHQKLEHLDTALKTAFSKIKGDITALQQQQARLEQRLNINSIKHSLKEEILHELKQTTEQGVMPDEEKEGISQRSVKLTEHLATHRGTSNTAGLAPLHLELLKRLMLLQMESGKRYLSMRDLTTELYPHKEYATIKATLSEYIKRLHEEGFVEKRHQGRLYQSLTIG